MTTDANDFTQGRLRGLLARLVLPADEWALTPGGHRTSPLVVLLGLLVVVLLLAGSLGYLLFIKGPGSLPLLAGFYAVLFVGLATVTVLTYRVNRSVLRPLGLLRAWALRMCKGDLSARIEFPQTEEFGKLAYHINRLSAALDKLANEMDELVWTQTERLHQKNRSLEILYEVAAAINTSRDLDELLERSARKLLDVVDGRAATVRLRTADGSMRLQKSIGLENLELARESPLAVEGSAFSEIQILLEKRPVPTKVSVDSAAVSGKDLGLITIPLRYQSQNLGVYSLFTPTPQVAEDPEVRRLLESVGKHLGMAVEKARLDKEGQDLSIMRERSALAHELHDSLAQTLSSLRFQVKTLSEELEPSSTSAAVNHEVKLIQNSLEEANTELRELLVNFRAPVDRRGLVPALEDLTARFRTGSGTATYFQTECPGLKLSPAVEMQVVRIVGEALANVRRHSAAKTVRVLLKCGDDGTHSLLIEDDGVGFGAPVLEGHPGDHVGLSIMEERAHRIGGELRIESEPGEGTRILLTFGTEPSQHELPIQAGAA